jgi:hypothetical protein
MEGKLAQEAVASNLATGSDLNKNLEHVSFVANLYYGRAVRPAQEAVEQSLHTGRKDTNTQKTQPIRNQRVELSIIKQKLKVYNG